MAGLNIPNLLNRDPLLRWTQTRPQFRIVLEVVSEITKKGGRTDQRKSTSWARSYRYGGRGAARENQGNHCAT